ncbi:CorA-like magnesium transporter protein [Ceratobasidium sp. AG-Ba]|nr:CorA-like magnesium transporter protein [Ceratobasidium sp. AG-Ba]QRW02090.1 CorA-like magnesium transporter protein [Ceratobasidium sp. AG-Ba]
MELLPVSSSSNLAQTLSVPPVKASPSARDRFRALVNRVIKRNRACAAIQELVESASPEQGIDPKSVVADRRYGSQQAKCTIEVTHYSESRCRTANFTNSELVRWLGDNFPQRRSNEIRWINIGGISWDVIKALAIRYDLHPLSIEDVMTGTRDKYFKVDYYTQHLFAQLTSYKLKSQVDEEAIQAAKRPPANSSSSFHINGRARVNQRSSPMPPTLQLPAQDQSASPASRPKSLKSQSSSISELGRSALAVVHPIAATSHSHSADENAIQVLKLQSGTLDIKSTRVFVFLLRDGTLISIHEDPNLHGAELREQLHAGSLIRSMEDVSMLFHGFLDLTVDHLIQISDGYHLAILALERSVLLKPTLAAVQTLHLLSGDIELLRMAIRPLQRIIYGLRRYDKERYRGLAISPEARANTTGFLSEETKIYLTDVYDHVRYVMLSLDTHSSTTRELISFTFNLTSCDSTNVMRKLLIVTVIFLPLTFITQYFGMNFATMDSVQQHSDALFWKIAGPVIGTLILIALRNRLLKVILPEH